MALSSKRCPTSEMIRKASTRVIAAANLDAQDLGRELDESNIVVYYVRTTEDA